MQGNKQERGKTAKRRTKERMTRQEERQEIIKRRWKGTKKKGRKKDRGE